MLCLRFGSWWLAWAPRSGQLNNFLHPKNHLLYSTIFPSSCSLYCLFCVCVLPLVPSLRPNLQVCYFCIFVVIFPESGFIVKICVLVKRLKSPDVLNQPMVYFGIRCDKVQPQQSTRVQGTVIATAHKEESQMPFQSPSTNKAFAFTSRGAAA